MDNWIIENAGLFDFSISEFSAALQIDWNYHSFQQLTIRNNYWNGIDIIYNDLTKKPAIRNSRFENNRRHGFKIRSPGMTIEDVIVSGNGNAGFRYNPRVSVSLQRDIITWLERREQPEMEANNVYVIPNRNITTLSVNPFAAVCNQRNPHITTVQQYYRSFRKESEPYVLGGTIWENEDLGAGRYTVIDDLNVVPGARLTISPGTVFEFSNGVGMLVQGEMIRADFQRTNEPITFTSGAFQIPKLPQIRLVDESDNQEVTAGRLEVYVNGQWGTICNRSWTQDLARLACNQLGLIMDSEYFENWRIFPSSGSLPIIMDNIRCEEREYDLTRCRHDGVTHNVASSCASTEVVGK
ncbi:HHIP-like protein 1 [Toxocara canis]|uniref:HHIP-like protein 1 n=1 Tax=Toxocara canis TaxID=6265 RepID=A0A0B2V0K3_TOXCA|nr:HHIP-like protein 1 [Toxocara canis]